MFGRKYITIDGQLGNKPALTYFDPETPVRHSALYPYYTNTIMKIRERELRFDPDDREVDSFRNIIFWYDANCRHTDSSCTCNVITNFELAEEVGQYMWDNMHILSKQALFVAPGDENVIAKVNLEEWIIEWVGRTHYFTDKIVLSYFFEDSNIRKPLPGNYLVLAPFYNDMFMNSIRMQLVFFNQVKNVLTDQQIEALYGAVIDANYNEEFTNIVTQRLMCYFNVSS